MTRNRSKLVRTLIAGLTLIGMLVGGSAAAFTLDMTAFPPGSHFYAFEITSDSLGEGTVMRVEYDVRQNGDAYDITTTTRITNSGLQQGEVMDALGGGGALAMFMFGPSILFYGPAVFVLPLVLADQDVAVRQDPITVEGFGTLHMDRSERVAGLECVVLRYEPEDDTEPMEIALAEGLPFPCYSIYGEDDDRTTMRLVEVR